MNEIFREYFCELIPMRWECKRKTWSLSFGSWRLDRFFNQSETALSLSQKVLILSPSLEAISCSPPVSDFDSTYLWRLCAQMSFQYLYFILSISFLFPSIPFSDFRLGVMGKRTLVDRKLGILVIVVQYEERIFLFPERPNWPYFQGLT